MNQPTQNILFVCSRNKWRSLTAETIFKNHGFYLVKPAGTEDSTRIKINRGLLLWADLVFVMEQKHLDRLNQRFPNEISTTEVVVLDIPDEYQYMNDDLIELLKENTKPFVDLS